MGNSSALASLQILAKCKLPEDHGKVNMLISHDEIKIVDAIANESNNLSAAAAVATAGDALLVWEMSAANKKPRRMELVMRAVH
jgi:hypothetical protein